MPVATFARHKGEANLHTGAFEPRLLMIDKTTHQTVAESVGGLEGGNQKMIQGRLDIVGKQGWEHGGLSQRGLRAC